MRLPFAIFTCLHCMCTVTGSDVVVLESPKEDEISGIYASCDICDKPVCHNYPKDMLRVLREEGVPTLAEQAHNYLESLEV